MQVDTVTWVVYLMTIHKRPDRFMAVCEQSEWDAMERSRPGYHHLVRAGIATEVEAEALARSDRGAEPPVLVPWQSTPLIRAAVENAQEETLP